MTAPSIDFNIFKPELPDGNECNQDSNDPFECDAITRLIKTMEYYASLDVMNTKDDQDKFSAFISEHYCHLLDDFAHLINEHDNLAAISKALGECDVTKCNFTKRYHSRNRSVQVSEDKVLSFYAVTIDSLHFHLFHLFQCGLRPLRADIRDTDNNDSDLKNEDDNAYVNNGVSEIVQDRKHLCTSFDRFKVNTKFVMSMNKKDNDSKEDCSADAATVIFQSGKRFMYWKHYKNKAGYIYVEPKHAAMKDEIMETASMQVWNQLSVKAEEYMKTEHVKTLESKNLNYLKYEIDKEQIKKPHLCSIIFYTDYTEESARFSATFRQISNEETVEGIKKRNSEYANIARLLREVIELFGTARGIRGNGIHGPFYTGLNDIYHIANFAITLNGPTSTTKQLMVAMQFTRGDGTIIVINNYGSKETLKVNTFGVGWISDFRYEDEYIFFGGTGPLRIESVIIDQRHYGRYFRVLYLFDVLISGMKLSKGEKVPNHSKRILSKLLALKLKDEYITTTFKMFCDARTELILNYVYIHNRDLKKLADLVDIFELLNIFKNVKELKFYTSNLDGTIMYPLNVNQMVKNIFTPKYPQIKKITVISKTLEKLDTFSTDLRVTTSTDDKGMKKLCIIRQK